MKLIANYKIRHNGETVAVNGVFESDDQGLIDCGAARLADSTDVTDSTQLDETEQAQAIHDVLVAWIDEDPEQANETRWTKAGNPRNDALDNALDFDVANAVALPIWEQIVKARTVASDD